MGAGPRKGSNGPVVLEPALHVEAGVVYDFPVPPRGWRRKWRGLDQIVFRLPGPRWQTARGERRPARGRWYVVRSPEEGFPPPPELQQNAEIARDILRAHTERPAQPPKLCAPISKRKPLTGIVTPISTVARF